MVTSRRLNQQEHKIVCEFLTPIAPLSTPFNASLFPHFPLRERVCCILPVPLFQCLQSPPPSYISRLSQGHFGPSRRPRDSSLSFGHQREIFCKPNQVRAHKTGAESRALVFPAQLSQGGMRQKSVQCPHIFKTSCRFVQTRRAVCKFCVPNECSHYAQHQTHVCACFQQHQPQQLSGMVGRRCISLFLTPFAASSSCVCVCVVRSYAHRHQDPPLESVV